MKFSRQRTNLALGSKGAPGTATKGNATSVLLLYLTLQLSLTLSLLTIAGEILLSSALDLSTT